ncbi:hypothetical protein ACGTNG_12270 [Halomonas sp. 1390]
MFSKECFAFMGWLGWLMPLAFMLLLGLGIAALAKYFFTSRRSQEDRS